MVDFLVNQTNEVIAGLQGIAVSEGDGVAGERRGVEAELANLIDFVAKGQGASPRLRAEIQAREERLRVLEERSAQLGSDRDKPVIQVDRSWVHGQVERLRQLLETDPSGARREIQKRIDDVRVVPATEAGNRVVRLTGRVNVDGLLGGEEAVRLQIGCGGWIS